MNNVKKNNKGFSLVELIVVVLIMAIIAVSLAPQVMKWVENSKVAQDYQLKDSIASAFTVAATDSKVYGQVYGVTITGNTVTWTGAAEDGSVKADPTATNDIIVTEIDSILKLSQFKCTSAKTDIKVEISADGVVTGNVYQTGKTDVYVID